MSEYLTIAETSARYGVSHRALRYYEARGLLRAQRGARRRSYGPADQARVEQIIALKRLGATLSEIAELIASGHGPTSKMIVNKIAFLERRREDDGHMLIRLRTMLAEGDGS